MNEATIMGAVTFLGGSVLLAFGILVLVAALVAVNNILHRYWKPLNWIQFHDHRPDYITPKVAPVKAETNPTVYKSQTKEKA